MPRIIRQAFGERLRRDPAVKAVLADFRAATGVAVEFVGPLGHRDEFVSNGSPVCARLRNSPGCSLCARFHHQLLEAAHEHSATRTCDAGLCESAVPLRAGGSTLGYFVTSGYTAGHIDVATLNRSRHLLGYAGVRIGAADLSELLARTPAVEPARQTALVRVLEQMVAQLAATLAPRIVTPELVLPTMVEEACRIVKAEYAQRLSIPAIAARIHVSSGHLSRTFHRATGLRFVEYIARVRADHARTLLLETATSVTEIAFACGFQSLSQFNRVFRAQFGICPTGARRTAQITSS